MRVSIIMATFNRAHLLARSLECYERQTHKDFELIVVDDDSSDLTETICRGAASGSLDLKYVRMTKWPNMGWRDGASIINFALRAAEGDLIIQTHPEVMPGFKSIEALVELVGSPRCGDRTAQRSVPTYVSCKPYYLTREQQAQIDSVPWREQGPMAVRQLQNFYGQTKSAEFRGDPNYLPEAIEQSRTWESFVFGGMTRKGWRKLGGIPQTAQWGSVDVSFLKLRQQHGIITLTPDDPQTYCVHQNHDGADDVPTPRNLSACLAALVTERQDNINW